MHILVKLQSKRTFVFIQHEIITQHALPQGNIALEQTSHPETLEMWSQRWWRDVIEHTSLCVDFRVLYVVRYARRVCTLNVACRLFLWVWCIYLFLVCWVWLSRLILKRVITVLVRIIGCKFFLGLLEFFFQSLVDITGRNSIHITLPLIHVDLPRRSKHNHNQTGGSDNGEGSPGPGKTRNTVGARPIVDRIRVESHYIGAL
mmetsp:Transcript_17418/g.28934  ORF Transcript_17418/g.28934 Transcript_17418/m.28934 type:complete len:203 (-) Transcript_17418:653-1261(-)